MSGNQLSLQENDPKTKRFLQFGTKRTGITSSFVWINGGVISLLK